MRIKDWLRAAAGWLTSRSTRALRTTIAISGGVAGTLYQLSPWSTSSGIGYAIFWVAIGAFILLLIAEWPIRMWMRRRAVQFQVPKRTLLKGSYIDSVVAIGRSIMGDGHANSETMRARLDRCPDGLQVLVRRSDRAHVSDKVVGYFACWTISAEASDRFATGEYRSALDLQEDDFVVDAPGAVYITMLYGTDIVARRQMIKIAVARLRELFQGPNFPQLLLARPATHDGELLMRKTGMKPLHGEGDVVWSIDGATLRETLGRSEL